jgi:predicted dehydrogenase
MVSVTTSSLGCALIGPGNFGRRLADGLHDDGRARLVGVLGATAQESQAGADALGRRAFADLEALLRAEDVQAVLIATPSDTHVDLAVLAASAGKHVFVEKPMALTVAECDAMIAAAERAGVTLMVGQVQRLFPLLAEVRRLVHAGTIGRPVAMLMERHEVLQRQPGSWLQRRAQVGGVLHQSSVHELDWMRTVFGEVDEVFARAAPATIQAGLDFPDAVQISLRFRGGCVATLNACMTGYVYKHGGVISGLEGSLEFSLAEGALRWRTHDGRGDEQRRDDFTWAAHDDAIRVELRAFVDAALGQAPILIPGSEGRANVEVIQAALISIADRRPVALPLPPEQWERRAYLEARG